MRSWILGLLCLVLVAFVAARYQDLDADDIDAELETLEHALRARNEAANQKRGLDLEKMSNEELQELLEELEEEDKREAGDNLSSRGWGSVWRRVRRYLPFRRFPYGK